MQCILCLPAIGQIEKSDKVHSIEQGCMNADEPDCAILSGDAHLHRVYFQRFTNGGAHSACPLTIGPCAVFGIGISKMTKPLESWEFVDSVAEHFNETAVLIKYFLLWNRGQYYTGRKMFKH